MTGPFAIEEGRKEMERPKLPPVRRSIYRDLLELWPFWAVIIAVAVGAFFLGEPIRLVIPVRENAAASRANRSKLAREFGISRETLYVYLER